MATKADFDRIGNYARMYNPDQNIDRHKCHRVVPMEVLSLGYSRTGTLSMQKALEILGYPNPYHFSSFLDNIRDCDMWLEAIDWKFNGIPPKGKDKFDKEQFDQLLGHVGAVTDMPSILFAQELIDYYPDAKIVLVERDIDAWYKSWSALVDNGFNPLFPILAKLEPHTAGRQMAVGHGGMERQMGGGTNARQCKARAKEEYRKYYAHVRSITPKDRLLEFDLKQGWGPLCKFLGKPVPNVPFPHINETHSMELVFKEAMSKMIKQIFSNLAVATVVVGLPAFAIWRYRALFRRG